MPKYRVPPGATSFQMQDGTFIRGRGNSRRGMTIEVDDPNHAKAVDRAAKEGHIIRQEFSAPKGVGERVCPSCSFTAWPWQSTCPRCGAETEVSA